MGLEMYAYMDGWMNRKEDGWVRRRRGGRGGEGRGVETESKDDGKR